MVTQSRWKSPVLWTASVAQVLALLELTGALKAMGIDAGIAGKVVAGLFELWSLVGIVQNPTDAKNW